MAYAELISLVRATIKDTQVDDDQAKSFIALAELKLQRDLMAQNYGSGVPRQMLRRDTGQTDANSQINLPANFLNEKALTINAVPARYVAPERVVSSEGFGESDYVLTYYQRIPTLSDAAPTNWLLDLAQDLYLWAACLQYVPWSIATEAVAMWQQYYTDGVRTLKEAEKAQPKSGLVSMRDRPFGAVYTKFGSIILLGAASSVSVV